MAEASRDEGVCARAAAAGAYLDGELDRAAADEFCAHARTCAGCSAALLEQRRLLCLLDSAFDRTFDKRVPVPEGFARQLKARAQNDLSGVRDARERRRAVKICAALGAAAFGLLGFAALEAVTGPLLGAARAASGVLGVTGRAASDAGAASGVVLRALGGWLASGSVPLALALAALFVGGFALLLLLISGYHRASARE